jgi:hypothetical protein
MQDQPAARPATPSLVLLDCSDEEGAAAVLRFEGDVDAAVLWGFSPLQWAVHRRLLATIAQLARRGASLAPAALADAAMKSTGALATLLHAYPHASVDCVAEGIGTPLHAACLAGCCDNVRQLLRRGADASLRDCDGFTATQLARGAGYDAIAVMCERAVCPNPSPWNPTIPARAYRPLPQPARACVHSCMLQEFRGLRSSWLQAVYAVASGSCELSHSRAIRSAAVQVSLFDVERVSAVNASESRDRVCCTPYGGIVAMFLP